MTVELVISALVLGLLFGFALQKSGLGNYDKVVNQFRFKDNTMIKFMLTAVAVGSVGTFGLRELGVLDTSTMPTGFLIAALVGGAILGIGMAIAGTCPGTIFAGIGQGNLDYLIPGVLGMFVGSTVYGLTFDVIGMPIRENDNYATGPLNVADLLGINPWALVAVIVVGVVVFYLLCRRHNARTVVASTLALTFVLILGGCTNITASESNGNLTSESSVAISASSTVAASSSAIATSSTVAASSSAATTSSTVATTPSSSSTSDGYAMTPADVDAASDDASTTIIDVRNYSYYVSGYIPGAVNIPLKNLRDGLRTSEVPTDGLVILYGATDDDANEARQVLLDSGYDDDDLKILEGGFQAWSAAGLPVGKPSTPGC